MYQEFIQNHPAFNTNAYSEAYRDSVVRTLQGLGLPLPYYSRREPWGYYREGMVYMPIEQDLLILLQSVEMSRSKQYLLPDVIEWFNSTPITRKLSPRGWKYARSDRPPFPELRLPPRERINLVYYNLNATTPASEKDSEGEKANKPTGTQEDSGRDSQGTS